MREILVAVLIFVCLAGASLGALLAYQKLPQKHREEDTNTTIRLVAGLFTVMTSLVMGLTINSAKTTFESIDQNLHAYATELILLDRTLRLYDPEADVARVPLGTYVERLVKTSSDGDPTVANKLSEHLLEEVRSLINAINPPDPQHLALWEDARQRFHKVFELRWTLIEQSEGTLPIAMIVMLVTWLVLIFGSLGYRAPRNAVVVSTFLLASALISGSIYRSWIWTYRSRVQSRFQ